ncbi:MAG: hemolysin family protein [Rectinema sp.]
MLSEILIILALILLNGLFSLAEMAVVSSRKARLRHEADLGKKSYKLALETAEEPSRFFSSIQIAMTLIGILTGAVGGATVAKPLEALLVRIPVLESIANPLSVGIVVLATTLLSVLLGELVPKSIALSRPESIAASVVRPLLAFGNIFYPIVKLLSFLTDFIVGLLGFKAKQDPEVTEEEVKVLIAQGAETGVFENSERDMVEGVLSLDDRRVTAFMTPRPEVVVLDLEDEDESPRDTIIAHADLGYLPVVEGDLDNAAGMLRVKDALAAMARGEFSDVRALIRPAVLIPESISALRAISSLKSAGTSAALIVDEYGGVSGLVTLGDLMDSVTGGLSVGGDEAEPEIVRRDDGSWLVDGAMSVADFVEALGIDEPLSSGVDYETVAGLVLDRMGTIPKVGDSCSWDGAQIEVMDMDGNRIDKVLVTRRYRPEFEDE